MASVRLQNISKKFDDVIAVENLSLTVEDGEFFSLLGPSGCGKTTVLRMIAGFCTPTAGEIFFDNRNVSALPPNKRNTGMVFQNYALFPHMTVFENVAFGLRARKVPSPERRERTSKALGLVDLSGLEFRRVTQLSGGQQQRVALARAIVIEPEILLLDEPLSNLDAKLRRETRDEIRKLQQELGITTIYVTHDQEEALTLSDKITLLDKGVCQQIGTPQEIYNHPANDFVVSFIGRSNSIEVVISEPSKEGVVMNVESDIRRTILDIADKIKREYRPEKIILFGSYAYGRPDRDSDIDLLIIKDTAERPIDRRVAVAGIVSDPKMLISVEALVLTPEEVRARLQIRDQFLMEILNKGEVLYAI